MKIMQINCVYKTGSTGKITYDLHKALTERGIESVVCFGRGKKVKEPKVYKTCGELYAKFNNLLSRITGVMYGGCFFSTNRLFSVIKKEKPDIVHLHCINGYFVNIYRLIGWLEKHNIKTVLTLHAEFMFTANCGYSLDCDKWKTGCGDCPRNREETNSFFLDGTARSYKKMKRAFYGFDDRLTVVSVSPWLMERAKQSPILKDKKHTVVMNGLDTDIFHIYDTESIKKKYRITDEKIIFYAAPYFTDSPNYIKGGNYIIDLAKRLKDENVRIFVAGEYDSGLKVPENIVLLGKIENQRELAEFYSMADVTVITSKKETFSMICAESLCCGTPVAAFKAGGPETIALADYSAFADYGDMDALINCISNFFNINTESQEISLLAQKKFDKQVMSEEYIDIYNKALLNN